MPVLNWGPCSKRSRYLELIETPDIDDENLERCFDFNAFMGQWAGGHAIVLDFLKNCSSRWTQGEPISILEIGCGRGDLARSIVNWGRRSKIELHIHAIDRYNRFIQMARDRHHSYKEITFDVRELNDALFLQAQQFDYVVCFQTLHRQSDQDALQYLKRTNLLAKRGFIAVDWLRDIRAWVWVSLLARLWRNEAIRHDGPLGIEKGFVMEDVVRLARSAGVDYAAVTKHMGYRFSLSGERGLVLAPKLAPLTRLAT